MPKAAWRIFIGKKIWYIEFHTIFTNIFIHTSLLIAQLLFDFDAYYPEHKYRLFSEWDFFAPNVKRLARVDAESGLYFDPPVQCTYLDIYNNILVCFRW